MLELLMANRPTDWPEEFPPRSYLHNLEPRGFDGATREDLRSYFVRLCIEVNLPPWSVALKLVAPLVSARRAINARTFANDWRTSSMCGLSQTAVDWSRALNQLTARDDLQLLTLLHVHPVLSVFLLSSKRVRYCPQCYASDIGGGGACYNRLLWTVDAVRACPLHRVRLMESCTCGLPSGAGRNYLHLGRCSYCAHDLSTCISKPADAREVDAARRVAEFLDAALYFSELQPQKGGVAQFLNHAIATLASGASAHFATAVGASKSSMHGWQNGGVVPSFPVLLRLAQYCDVGIADILLGNRSVMTPIQAFRMERKPTISRTTGTRPPSHAEVSKKLEELVAAGEADCVSRTASTIGVSDKFLRKQFPEVVQKIADTGRSLRSSAAEARRARRRNAFLQEHRRLTLTGARPSRRAVLRKLREDGIRIGRVEASNFHRLARGQLGK